MDGVKQVPSVHFAHSPLLPLLCSRQLVLSLRFLLDTDKVLEYTTTSSRRFLKFSHHHRVCTTTTSIISLPDLPNLHTLAARLELLAWDPSRQLLLSLLRVAPADHAFRSPFFVQPCSSLCLSRLFSDFLVRARACVWPSYSSLSLRPLLPYPGGTRLKRFVLSRVPILFVRTHAHRASAKPRNRSQK
jgi:hypothetical protein